MTGCPGQACTTGCERNQDDGGDLDASQPPRRAVGIRPMGGGRPLRGGHQRRKTLTIADATAARLRPPRTHGTPVAPSAANVARFRWPMAIFPAQIRSPATPQINTPHLPQAMIVVTGPVNPGGASGAGFGAGARAGGRAAVARYL